MYWLYLDCPQIALDLLQQQYPASQPLAIVEQSHIIYANREAQSQGIKEGQTLSTAQQMVPAVIIELYASTRIKKALEQLAQQLLRLTPKLTIIGQQGLLICSDGMETIYPTIQQHIRTLENEVHAQHIQVNSCATLSGPLATWLGQLRRQQTAPRIILNLDEFDFPLYASQLPSDIIQGLAALGITSLHQLLQWPRKQLLIRFDAVLLNYIDQCLGKQPTSYQWQRPAQRFRRKLVLNDEAHNSHQLILSCQYLIQALTTYLHRHQLACQQIILTLHYRQRATETLCIECTAPENQPLAWMEQLELRVERLTLAEPVIALTLSSDPCQPHRGQWYDLWQQTEQAPDPTFLERIAQRVGEESLSQLVHQNNHLPEHASQLKALDCKRSSTLPPLPQAKRPLWLLAQPQAIDEQQFACISSPEIIEATENGQLIVRNYQRIRFKSTGSQGWAFYNTSSGHKEWWLQGWFA